MARVIVEVLQEELGSRFDSDTKDAWEDGLKALINGISKSLKYSIRTQSIINLMNSKLIKYSVSSQQEGGGHCPPPDRFDSPSDRRCPPLMGRHPGPGQRYRQRCLRQVS